MKKRLIVYTSFALGMLLGPFLAGAANDWPSTGGGGGGGGNQQINRIRNPINAQSTAEVLEAFLKILVQIGAVAVTLAIVYAGFLFVAARGNPEELNRAKRTLMWTIIGALVLLGAQIIASVIGNTIKTIGA